MALTKELIQLGLTERTSGGDYRVLSRHYTRHQLDPDIVRQMGVALHDHAATLAHNIDAARKSPARFDRLACNVNVAPRYGRVFVELVEQRGQAFLEEMDEWLARHEVKPSTKSSTRGARMAVGVYVYREGTRKGRRA